MATGTSGGLLDDERAQSVFKHEILRQYIRPFIAMPGSTSPGKKLVVLDGFAGRGRYPDGNPGSTELILRAIRSFSRSRDVLAFFVEKDSKHHPTLSEVVQQYAQQGLQARFLPGGVEEHLGNVVREAHGVPMFFFLDPCGAGLTFEHLHGVLSGPRQDKRPQTEVLLNFSADLTRRAAGTLNKGHIDHPIISLMDLTCGGEWWRETAITTLNSLRVRNFEPVAHAVAEEYAQRLGRATSMMPVVIPVRRRLRQQPIYHLIFLTRSPYGLWVFADAVGRARKVYLKHLGKLDGEESPGQQALIGDADDGDMEWLIKQEHETAVEITTTNLRALVNKYQSVRLVDHTREIFGEAYGFAIEPTITESIKRLKKSKEISLAVNAKRLRDREFTKPNIENL